MTEKSYNYFVCAAVIAAKLDNATRTAQQLSLTASNARAVALRAGERAAGFRPLTDFIDRLANITISSSKSINLLAAKLSNTSAEKMRANGTLKYFDETFIKAKDSPYINSLDNVYEQCKSNQLTLLKDYKKQIKELSNELENLSNELRNAVILATLSRVEASQAGDQYQESLINVAENVDNAAKEIKEHIIYSQKLVATLE